MRAVVQLLPTWRGILLISWAASWGQRVGRLGLQELENEAVGMAPSAALRGEEAEVALQYANVVKAALPGRGPRSIQLSPESELPGWRRTTPELLQSGPKRVVRPSCCKVVPNGWSKVVSNYSSGGTWTGKPPVARLNFAPQKLKPIPRAGCSSPDFETRAQRSNFKPQSLRPRPQF